MDEGMKGWTDEWMNEWMDGYNKYNTITLFKHESSINIKYIIKYKPNFVLPRGRVWKMYSFIKNIGSLYHKNI